MNTPGLSIRNQVIIPIKRALWVLWLVVGFVQGQSGSPVHLDLGMDVAGPGQHVILPLTFSTDGSLTVTRIVLETSFSEQKLLYAETLPGTAVESVEIDIESRLVDSEDGEGQDRLRVEISSPQGLPAGELVRISFQISEDAELNEDILVRNVFRSIETIEGEGQQVSGADGVIAVIANAFFSCLFYMH